MGNHRKTRECAAVTVTRSRADAKHLLHQNQRKRNCCGASRKHIGRNHNYNSARSEIMLKEMEFPQVYLVCGYTDMRRGIDGLAAILQQNYGLEPCSGSLFLFCGRRRDRLKALLWEEDGFL